MTGGAVTGRARAHELAEHLAERIDSLVPELLEWRPLHHKTLSGFTTVRLTPPGLIIHDLPVYRSGDSLYVLMLGKLVIDKDSQVVTDEHGKRRYGPVVEVPNRDARQRISAAVVALVQRRDQEALK
jgi:hypothetical protein